MILCTAYGLHIYECTITPIPPKKSHDADDQEEAKKRKKDANAGSKDKPLRVKD